VTQAVTKVTIERQVGNHAREAANAAKAFERMVQGSIPKKIR
jgi:hypothetical protein